MLKFTLADNKIKLDGIHSAFSFVKEIKRKYKGDFGTRVLTFIHIVARIDPSAPFFTASEIDIRELATMQLFSETEVKKLNKKQINSWIEEYKKIYETPEVRIVNIFNNKVDQIRNLIENTEPELEKVVTTNGAVSFVSNIQLITKTMEELGNLLTVKEKLEAKIRKEVIGGVMRAGKSPSLLEKQMTK